MIIYEFWLKSAFREEAFEALCDSFYNLGRMNGRWDDPRDDQGDPVEGTCVYAVSRNQNTHWVQLLVDDNTPQPIITAIETRINGLKDEEPLRKYFDEHNNMTPEERLK